MSRPPDMTAPMDTWLVCGFPVDDHADNRGCSCHPNDPTRRRTDQALARLDDDERRAGGDSSPTPRRARRGA